MQSKNTSEFIVLIKNLIGHEIGVLVKCLFILIKSFKHHQNPQNLLTHFSFNCIH